jgi:teichuronic acid biosynthesis glycosyltransferase TuaG
MINISVIVTTYNRPKLLKETLDSILNQTYVDFELIVVDNNSNYDFFKLIKSFNDKRIIAYQNENNGIIAVNRNFGIRKAKGQYIAFCDDDDLWVKNKLELQAKIVLNNNVDFISSNVFLFNKNIDNIIGKTNNRLVFSLNDFLNKNHINTSTVLAKKSTLLKFNESADYITVEDYQLWLKLYQNKYKFSFINTPLVYYRILENTMSQKDGANKHLRLISVIINVVLSETKGVSFIIFNKIIILNYFKFIIKKIIGFISK